MSLTELFPAIKQLPRADKLRLMQFLVIDLAQEEGVPLLAAASDVENVLGRNMIRRVVNDPQRGRPRAS